MIRKMSGAILALALAAGVAPAQMMITAGGATFPYPLYSKWFSEYQKSTKVQVNYQSQGSGFGISAVTAGTIDFGASDRPMTDAELKAYKDKHGFGIFHFPMVLGANVAVYNIPSVRQAINLTPEALGGNLPR